MANEFDDLAADQPPTTASDMPTDADELISSAPAGVEYDYSKAPDSAKMPPRIDLGKKKVQVMEAKLILPPSSNAWLPCKVDPKKSFKACTLKLYYSEGGQQETYSGVRVFKRDDGKYSHPTFTRDRKNQASKLLGTYADFKKVDINTISLKEFMGFLNSKPFGEIEQQEFENPNTNQKIKKNIIVKFV